LISLGKDIVQGVHQALVRFGSTRWKRNVERSLGRCMSAWTGFQKALEEAEPKRMATSNKVKRRLEVLNDRVLLIEQKRVS
jgi:hypothetical protein